MRVDEYLAKKGIVRSRSHAKDLVTRGKVRVNDNLITKAGYQVKTNDNVVVDEQLQLVSRAGEKLASVYKNFNLNFTDKVVLDVGSSTGGFTDFALQNGAKKVIAVDVGTDQLAEILRTDPRVELHEKTDIRDFDTQNELIDYVLIDVSFVSLRKIMPALKKLCQKSTLVIAMVKPQFEATIPQKNKGVIKNSRVRKEILNEFEIWVKKDFAISATMDSQLSGTKGNVERFYRLQKT